MRGALLHQQQRKSIDEKMGNTIPINDDLVSISGRLVNIKAGIHLHLNAKYLTMIRPRTLVSLARRLRNCDI